jgi:hypothetical protein
VAGQLTPAAGGYRSRALAQVELAGLAIEALPGDQSRRLAVLRALWSDLARGYPEAVRDNRESAERAAAYWARRGLPPGPRSRHAKPESMGVTE